MNFITLFGCVLSIAQAVKLGISGTLTTSGEYYLDLRCHGNFKKAYLTLFFPVIEALETERKKESQEDSVETYQEAFEKIKEMTGEDDLDLLVHRFIEVEDKNFALFNYVNEQNNEIETLNDSIQEVGGMLG